MPEARRLVSATRRAKGSEVSTDQSCAETQVDAAAGGMLKARRFETKGKCFFVFKQTSLRSLEIIVGPLK